MAVVSGLLTPDGFTVDPAQGFSVDDGDRPMGLTRTKKGLKGRKLKPILTPSRLRMVFDRGRVNLALSVDDNYNGSGMRFSRYSGAPKRVVAGRQQYLISLAETIQALVTGYIEPADAAAQHAAAEEEVRKLNRKIRNRSLIILGVVFAALFGIIVLAVIAGSMH
ncbi:MAG: hypothetical protein JWM57_3835 [Phycisphaerales bacterium]|nr:hypothetical protein [Phycisphaerales bacterium]